MRRDIQIHVYFTLLCICNLTCDADVTGLQVRRKVALTRSYIDQRPDTNVARPTTGALSVEQRDDVIRTAEIVVAPDAPSQTHPTVHR